jgi:hypothetical protein
MNRIAEIVVAFESSVAEPLGPNAVWEPDPPNARQVRSLPALQQHYNNQEDAHRNVHNG